MRSTEAPVDVDVLRDEIKKTYTDVSSDAAQDFIFPTGRAWAEELGYYGRRRGTDGRLVNKKIGNVGWTLAPGSQKLSVWRRPPAGPLRIGSWAARPSSHWLR